MICVADHGQSLGRRLKREAPWTLCCQELSLARTKSIPLSRASLMFGLSALVFTVSSTCAPWAWADHVYHNVSAGLLNVAQYPTWDPTVPNADDNTNCVVTLGLSINDFRIGTYNRADYNVQAGPTAANQYLNGVLMTSVAENVRNNNGTNAYPSENTNAYPIATIITNANGSYRICSWVCDAAGTGGSSVEYNVNVAGAYFPYSQYLGGYARNRTGANGSATITNDTFTASPGLVYGVNYVELGGGTGIVDLRDKGIDSRTDGILLVTGAKDENNFALSQVDATNGTWNLFLHDQSTSSAGSYEPDPIAFVFIPKNATNLVSGRVNSDGAIGAYSGNSPQFIVANIATGTYHLQVNGRGPTNGILIISCEGGGHQNLDNIINYQATASGDGWIVQSRDTPNMGLQSPASTSGGPEPAFDFVFIPAPLPGIAVTPTNNLLTTQSGGTASFTVVLDIPPTANVYINVDSSDTAEGTVDKSTLTFTTSNWNLPQTVTITGQNDSVPYGSVPYTVRLAPASSADLRYDGINPEDVSVLNINNLMPGISNSATDLTTTDRGGTATFTVRLTTQPSANALIPLVSSNTNAGTVSPASLTFTPANYATPQTVTITGALDLAADGDLAYTINIGPAVSADPGYSGLINAQVVSVVNRDTDGTINDVRHVVIFMQENRSFDHYFGSLKGVRGFNDRNVVVMTGGNPVFYQPQSSGYVLPFPISIQCVADVDHSWGTTHDAWDSGKWDKWLSVKGSTTMAYYSRLDLPFYYALAESYTICDDYHASVLGPTHPNRLHLWTGMIDPNGTGGGPVLDNTVPTGGFTWTTYAERLQNAGVTWRVYQETDSHGNNALQYFAQYQNAAPGNPLYDYGMTTATDLVTGFRADVVSGTLPRVSWVVAPSTFSEHPPDSPANGEALTKELLDALAANPAVYNSTIFMLVYDENDGFFDHVPPPVPPAGTADEFVGGLPIGLGARVPMILISLWSRGGHVCSQVFDHTSVIRFLETLTGVREPNISAWRRQVCGDLTAAFDFKHPNTNYPALPTVSGVTCPSGSTPSVPSPQTFPTQEGGTLLARRLPYQPNATSYTDCGAGRFYITMTNAGSTSVHFALYPNAYRLDGPWQYDVGPGYSVADSFIVSTNGGPYDFTCYGPNGFQRRFSGKVDTNCNRLEVTSSFDLEGITLALRNSTASPVIFTVTNGYATGGPWIYNVLANSTVTAAFPALVDNNGWYDLTATASGFPSFLRRFAGHVEITSAVPSPQLWGSLTGAVADGLVLTWNAAAGVNYQVQRKSNLAETSWQVLGLLTATNSTASWTDPKGNAPQRFYRVVAMP